MESAFYICIVDLLHLNGTLCEKMEYFLVWVSPKHDRFIFKYVELIAKVKVMPVNQVLVIITIIMLQRIPAPKRISKIKVMVITKSATMVVTLDK